MHLDVKSTNYVLDLYHELVLENGMENNIVFTVSNGKWLENEREAQKRGTERNKEPNRHYSQYSRVR